MKIVYLAVACLWILCARVSAEILVNGSFENPSVPADAILTELEGWVVVSGNIDVASWTPSHGEQSIDLAGNTIGAIEQSFNTSLGSTYTFSFDYSDNPYVGSDSARVEILDALSESVLYSTTVYGPEGNSAESMMWQTFSDGVVASSSSSIIRFTSLNSNNYGSASVSLDNVSVVPEPALVAMFGILSGLGLFIRRRFSR